MNKKIRNSIFIACCLGLTWSTFSYSGQASYALGIDADYVKQEVTTESDNVTLDVNNQILSPYLLANYTGPKLFLQGTVTNNHVRRQLEAETVSQNYLEYNYTGRYQIIDNLLSINTTGSSRFLSGQIQNFNVDNFLLNAENLGEAKTNSVGANLNIPRGDFFGLTAFTSYRETSFERNQQENAGNNNLFDNDSYNLGFNLLSGTDLTNVNMSLNGNIANIKRGERQDFDSHSLSASIDVGLVSNFALAINGFYENNELQAPDNNEDFDGLNEFYSAGVGLIYKRSQNKYIEVAYNRSRSEGRQGREDEENDFVSADLSWAFTERTNITGNYSRRFFGDAGSFSFNHRTRNWRSSIRYNESVTSNSQLINTTIPGLLICDEGFADFSECSLSDSPDGPIGEGQLTVPIQIAGFGINDRIVIRKGLTAQTLVNRRRSTFSITGSRSKSEEIEVDRLLDNTTLRSKLTFNISHKSQLVLDHSFRKLEVDTAGELSKQNSNEYSVELKRNLNNDFSASLIASYLNRNGDAGFNNQFQGLNGSLTDRRITLRISYQFANGRFQ